MSTEMDAVYSRKTVEEHGTLTGAACPVYLLETNSGTDDEPEWRVDRAFEDYDEMKEYVAGRPHHYGDKAAPWKAHAIYADGNLKALLNRERGRVKS